MRFKLDENIHPDIAALLVSAGHDVSTVWEQGMRGATDELLAAVLKSESRVILTFDVGFGNIRRYPPAEFAGIIVLRLRSQSRSAQASAVERLLIEMDTRGPAGCVWIIEDAEIRIRLG